MGMMPDLHAPTLPHVLRRVMWKPFTRNVMQ